MSDSYVLHDTMRKVKADGLFDSIRRDLISDIEQKSSYLDLKSKIESLMSTYLSEHKWSSSLKKSDIRERARRHIETSNLIKDTLPSLVNQYMQTCQQQLVQPRLSSFVSDHLDQIYNSIGGTHIYRPPTTFTVQPEKPPQTITPIKKEPIPSKPNKTPQTSKIIPKKKSLPPPPPAQPPTPSNPIREEKKTPILSPLHSPNELVDISPSPPASIENERRRKSSSPSPPPPVVRIAPPLIETPRKMKRLQENSEEKKKKIKTEDTPHKIIPEEKSEIVASTSNETDTRKLRSRRPNPKYLNEQFETEDLNILETPTSPSTKTKKFRQLKSFDTPSSPPPDSSANETSIPVPDMSPEYGTSLPSPIIEKQSNENIDEQSRTPSPVTVNRKKTTSPRRLRPRRGYERSSTVENQNESSDVSTRTSSKTRESHRHRTEQTSDDNDVQERKSRHPSSSGGDNSSNELPSRSISVPDNLNTTTDEMQTARISPVTAPAHTSKSFIWKPKISK